MGTQDPLPCEASCSRRTLLGVAAAGACAPLLAEAGCARRIEASPGLGVAGQVDGNLIVPRASVPQLDRVGASVILHPQDGSAPVLLANAGDGFLAVHALCPHAGCELTWVQEDRQLECPCHGSRFASDGRLLSPPAQDDIKKSYPVTIDRTTLAIVVHTKAGDGIFPAVQGGKVTFPIGDHPDLASVGGAVTGKPEGLGLPLTVLRFSATELRAFDSTCTHLECTVRHSSRDRRFKCPCHGSQYGEDGSVLSPPAAKPLRTYAASFDGTTVTVTVA